MSWYDEELIYSLILFITRGEEPRPIVVAYDEFEEQWAVVAEPDPDRGFDELGDLLRPWFEELYDEVPDELAVSPPEYEMFDEIA